MIQKSRPALLQHQDVGDRVETLMVNGREGKAGIPASQAQGGEFGRLPRVSGPWGAAFCTRGALITGWGLGGRHGSLTKGLKGG